MRRVARIDRSIDLLQTRASQHTTSICTACQRRSLPFSTSTRRAAKKPFTERLRQRIWGTENPPGQKDPYASPTSYRREQKQLRAEEETTEKSEEIAAAREAMMEGYQPAMEAKGLDSVGGFGGWWRQFWDPEHTFEGFMPKGGMIKQERLNAAVYRAVVEIFTMQQAGLPLSSAIFRTEIDPSLRLKMAHLRFKNTEEGLILDNAAIRDEMIQYMTAEPVEEVAEDVTEPTESEQDIEADRSAEDPLQEVTEAEPTASEELIAADKSPTDPLAGSAKRGLPEKRDPVWLQISLQDPQVKFALLKRTMQLTGRRIPDSALRSINSVGDVLTTLAVKPKPKKLVETLIETELSTLPNVKILPRRVTPIDKEIAIGRWKVIEKELMEQDLPVTGRG